MVEPGLVKCSSPMAVACAVMPSASEVRAARRRELGEAEIENLGVTAIGHENVCGLDVAMDDAFGMGSVKRVGDLDAQRKQGVQL